MTNNKERVENLLKIGADLNNQNNNVQAAPLHIAIASKNPVLAKLLIERGANIYVPDKSKFLPIMYAIKYDQFEIFDLLLNQMFYHPDQDINATRMFIEKGVAKLMTLLQYACHCNRDKRYLDLLLQAGADINQLGDPRFDNSPLIEAIHNNNQPLINYLAHQLANFNIQTEYKKMTPIMIAACAYNIAVCKQLLKFGAKVSLKNANNRNALEEFRYMLRIDFQDKTPTDNEKNRILAIDQLLEEKLQEEQSFSLFQYHLARANANSNQPANDSANKRKRQTTPYSNKRRKIYV